MAGRAKILQRLIPLATSLGLAGIILLVSYPGFMSYDSLVMIDEARNGVVGAPYNPGPVYILRLFDVFGQGPASLIFTVAFTIFFASYRIIHNLTSSRNAGLIGQAALFLSPVVSGCLFVLWKDNLMLALVLGSTALTLEETNKPKLKQTYKWIAFLLLLIAGIIRLNALPLVLIVFAIWLRTNYSKTTYLKQTAYLLGFGLISLVFLQASTAIRLPDFKLLPKNDVAYMTLKYDLYGISYFSGERILPLSEDPAISGSIPIEIIRKAYSPIGGWMVSENAKVLGVNQLLDDGSITNSKLLDIWLNKVASHPLDYLKHRASLFSQTVGAVNGEVFEPTHFGRVDENKFGFEPSNRFITFLALGYVKIISTSFFGKPILFMILGTTLWFAAKRFRRLTPREKETLDLIVLGSWLYVFTFFFLPPTGEVRYSMPSLALLIVVGVVCAWNLGIKSKHKK